MDIVKEGWNTNYITLGLFIIIVSTVVTFIIYNKKDMSPIKFLIRFIISLNDI